MTVLRQRMTEDVQVRDLSPHTQASYLLQVSLLARYFRTSPDTLTHRFGLFPSDCCCPLRAQHCARFGGLVRSS
jgi:hypothetical protein